MKHFFLFAVAFTAFFRSNSQSCYQFLKAIPGDLSTGNPNFYWGGQAFGNMLFDQNNNIYLTGRGSYFLTKYDSVGNVKWNKSKPGQLALDMEIYNSKHIYVTSINSTLCKFDTAGNELFTPVSVSNFTPTGIAVDPNENVYVVGRSVNTFSSGYEILIRKYSSSGSAIWTNTLSVTCNNSYRYNADIIATNNNLFLSSPGITNTCVAAIGSYTVNGPLTGLLAKMDLNGNCNWIKSVSTNTATSINFRPGMAFNNAGNLIIACDSFYVKDMNGNTIQSKLGYGDPVKVYNNKVVGMATLMMNNTPQIYKGDLSNSLPMTTVSAYLSNNNNNIGYNLIGLNNSGNLYAAYTTNVPLGWGPPSYVDLCQLAPSAPVLLARFNGYDRLYPQYSNAAMTCGDTVHLGPPNILVGGPEYNIVMPSYQNATFSWLPASGLSSTTIHNPEAYPVNTTQYTMTVNGTCPTTVNVTNNNPTSFSYSTNSMVATFSINSTACTSFLWDFGNGNTSSLNPNPIITYATAGTYGVCLKCNGQLTNCAKCINITVPSTSSGAIGINEIADENKLLIYPNPNNGEFKINFTDHVNNGFLKITNTLGSIIYSTNFSGSEIDLDLTLATGIYFVTLEYNSRRIVKKITVQ